MRINPFGHMFYTSIFLVKIVHNLVALPFEDFCWMQKKVFLEFFDNGCSTMKFESKSVWPGSLGILVIVAQVAKSGANYQIFSSILIYFFSKISPRRFISPPNSKKTAQSGHPDWNILFCFLQNFGARKCDREICKTLAFKNVPNYS